MVPSGIHFRCTMTGTPTFFFFLWPHLWHMNVQWELQLPAYTTATVTRDLSHICNLHCSSWQHQILNPRSEARDRTHILTETSQILNQLSHNGNSYIHFFLNLQYILS